MYVCREEECVIEKVDLLSHETHNICHLVRKKLHS